MRTDQNADFAFFQLFQNPFCIGWFTGTAQVIYLTRKTLEAFTESFIMLISQHRSRNQYCDLLIIRNCLKCRTNGNLRLSESHIPTNQTIHRTVFLHILFYLLGGLELVGSILINKRSLQFMLHKRIQTKTKTFFLFSLRIKFD